MRRNLLLIIFQMVLSLTIVSCSTSRGVPKSDPVGYPVDPMFTIHPGWGNSLCYRSEGLYQIVLNEHDGDNTHMYLYIDNKMVTQFADYAYIYNGTGVLVNGRSIKIENRSTHDVTGDYKNLNYKNAYATLPIAFGESHKKEYLLLASLDREHFFRIKLDRADSNNEVLAYVDDQTPIRLGYSTDIVGKKIVLRLMHSNVPTERLKGTCLVYLNGVPDQIDR